MDCVLTLNTPIDQNTTTHGYDRHLIYNEVIEDWCCSNHFNNKIRMSGHTEKCGKSPKAGVPQISDTKHETGTSL